MSRPRMMAAVNRRWLWRGPKPLLAAERRAQKHPHAAVYCVLCQTSLWRVCVWSVCCVDWLVYSLTWPESDWLDSGWVGLHTCGAWEQSWHPATNTLEEEPLSCLNLPNKHLATNIYPCPVSEGPKERRAVRSNPATVTTCAWRREQCSRLIRPDHTSNTVFVVSFRCNFDTFRFLLVILFHGGHGTWLFPRG